METYKPPIGVKPGWLHAAHRISDLAGAIERYANEGSGEARRILMRRWAEEIMMQLDIWEKLSDMDWYNQENKT